MLIDWFTVIAQLINFLILVYLLNRFLYKPITKTLIERQKRIEARWQEAEQQQEEARQEADAYRQKQQEWEDQREQRMAEAKEYAEQERKQLIHQARQEIERLQAGWRESVQREQESFLRKVQQAVVQQTYAIARRLLRDLADVDLEQRMIAIFLDRLRKLDEADRQALAESIQPSDREILIRSSFALSPETREQIVNALREHQIMNGSHLRFDISADLIGGIELQLPGQEVSWNADHYLRSLEEHLSVVLREPVETTDDRRQITPANRL